MERGMDGKRIGWMVEEWIVDEQKYGGMVDGMKKMDGKRRMGGVRDKSMEGQMEREEQILELVVH